MSRSSEETAISTRFRRALGASVLTTGLTLGGAFGAAIASADPGDASPGGGTTTSSGSSDTPGTGTASSSSAGTAGRTGTGPSLDKAIRDAVRAFTGGLGSQHRKSAQTAADEAADQAAADDAADAASAADPVESTADQSAATESSPAAGVTPVPTTDATTAVTDAAPSTAPATPTAQPAAQTSTGGSSATTPPIAAEGSSAPADTLPTAESVTAPVDPTLASLLQPTTAALTAATNFVVAVGDTVISLPALLAALPTSSTPVADVITYLQASLTSMGGALIPLVSLPSEVANAVLSLTANLPDAVASPVSAGPATGYLPGAGLDVPRAPVTPTNVGGDPSPRNPVTFALRGGFAAAPPVTGPARPATAPAASAPESHSNTPLLITGALAALLLSASLWALFAAALPGLGGLAAFSATGMRIGYRQAKAGTALYRSDLARFAPRGPIGVVRSDSLVSVHRRRGGTDEQPAKPHLRLVDTAA